MRCEAAMSDGKRCRVEFGADAGNRLFWHHNPKWADERRRAKHRDRETAAGQSRKFQQRTITEAEALEAPTTAEAVLWAARSWAGCGWSTTDVRKVLALTIAAAGRTRTEITTALRFAA